MPQILIRREEPSDADAIAAIMSDESVYAGTLQPPHASHQQWRDRLAKFEPAKYALVAEIGGRVIGQAGLFLNERLRQRHVAMLGIGVAGAHQRQGVGTALMRELLRAADGWLNVLRVELTVYTDNAHAVALYRKFGFEIEGTLRANTLRDGRYVDTYQMGRLHPNQPLIARAEAPPTP